MSRQSIFWATAVLLLCLGYGLARLLRVNRPAPHAAMRPGSISGTGVARVLGATGAPSLRGAGKVGPKPAPWKCSWIQVEHGDPKAKAVALTFDGDCFGSATLDIVHALRQHHVRATFFLTAHFCHSFPKECRALAEAGMEIGSHSYNHPYFTRITDAQINTQLAHAEAVFRETFGHATRPLFRFPYGDSDRRSQKAVARAGFQPIYWSLDTLDAVGRPKSADFVRHRTLSHIRPGDIVLMHVSSPGTARALPKILDTLEKRGLKVVPVSAFLRTHSGGSAPPNGG